MKWKFVEIVSKHNNNDGDDDRTLKTKNKAIACEQWTQFSSVIFFCFQTFFVKNGMRNLRFKKRN